MRSQPVEPRSAAELEGIAGDDVRTGGQPAEGLRTRWGTLAPWIVPAVAWIALVIPLRALLTEADRGLDLTDESHYLLAAQPWASSSAFNGVFGWYLGPWLRLTGNDIAVLRVSGVVVVTLAALWLGRCACVAAGAVSGRPLPAWLQWLVLPGTAAAALLHYLLFLRTPGYDLFASAGLLLVAAGVALLLADRAPAPWWREAGVVLSLGFGLAVAAVGKLPTAAAAIVVVLAAAAVPSRRRVALLRLLAAGVVLAVLVAAHLTVVSTPAQTLAALHRAGVVAGTLDPEHYALSGMAKAAITGVGEVLSLGGSWLWMLAVLPLLAAPAGLAARGRPGVRPLRAPLLVVLALPGLVVPTAVLVAAYRAGQVITGGEARFVLVFLATGGALALVQQQWRAALAGLVLLALALCFPLGTNNDYLLFMTSSAAVVAAGALLCVWGALPGRWAQSLVAVLVLTCLVTAAVVIPDVRERAPYRMVPLVQQTVRTTIVPGTPPLLVDPRTASWVAGLRTSADAAGWRPGTPLLDLSFNPAAVLVLDARAPGALLPTFPKWASRAATARAALSFEDVAVWRRAWLLVPTPWTPQVGPRDATTDEIVQALGRRFPADYRRVVRVSADFGRDFVELWEPVSP